MMLLSPSLFLLSSLEQAFVIKITITKSGKNPNCLKNFFIVFEFNWIVTFLYRKIRTFDFWQNYSHKQYHTSPERVILLQKVFGLGIKKQRTHITLQKEARESLNKTTEQARLTGVLQLPSCFVCEIFPISFYKTILVPICLPNYYIGY